ncbi:MAG: FAD-dependent oxidoreductase [Candidatus Methanomethylicia archaeon]
MDEYDVLVIGGGVAGLQASIDLTNAGFKVYLVEKMHALGGHTAQLYKIAPQLIDSSKVIEDLSSKAFRNVKLALYSNVGSVEKSGDYFIVEVEEEPKYVSWSKCNGCLKCIEKCPIKTSYNSMKIVNIPAIYTIPGNSLSGKPVIDGKRCLYFKGESCRICREICPVNAIDFSQKPLTSTFKCRFIIIATGFNMYNPSKIGEYSYDKHPNIITGLELELISNPLGPTKGSIVKPSSSKPPKSVAIVSCVGSRSEKHLKHCCRIGCTTSLKHAYYILDKLPEAEVYILYNDMRVPGRSYEEFYRFTRDKGVTLIRGIPSEIRGASDEEVSMKIYDEASSKLYRLNVDLVILEVGMETNINEVKAINIPVGEDKYPESIKPILNTIETPIPNIFVIGCAQAPLNIVESITQAQAATSKIIAKYRGCID